MVSEALRRSFMEFQLSCTSHLPWIWVLETLARSSQVDVSLLLDLVEKTRESSDDLSRSAREFVSLRILEKVVFKEASASPVSSTSRSKIDLNPSERCEDVVRKILLEKSASNLLSSGPDKLKWNLQSFVVQKRASLTEFALQQLKVSILEGSHPVVASLKKHSDFPVGNPSEPRVSTDGNCGITPIHEGCDALTQHGAGNILLKSPAFPHENDLSHRSLPIKHLLLAKRNGSGTFKSAVGKLCDDEMTFENGCGTCLKGAKKYKYDESTRIQQYSEGHSCPLEKIDYVGGMGKNGLSADNGCAPSQRPVGHNEVLLGVPFDKAGEEQEQYNIDDAEAEAENKGILEFKMTNQDMYTKEQTKKINVSKSGEPGDDIDTFGDSGYGEGSTDITTRRNAFLSSQCTYSQDSVAATDWRESNLCVKCNKDGKLLVCRSNSCTSAVHLHCLGSAMNSITMESFYCPSCAYSQAIKKYEEAKEKTSSALKDLIDFYCFGSRSAPKKQLVAMNQMKSGEGVEENIEVSYRNFIEGLKNCQREENVEDKLAEPSVSNSGDGLPAQEEPVESTNETLLTAKLSHGAKKMVQQYKSPQGQGQNHMDALVVYQFPVENLSRQDLERSDRCDRYIKIRSIASKSIDAEEMSDKNNDGTCASKYFVSSRSSVHQSRRTRRPWTSAEEETLKEGVRRHFSPDDKNIPWRTILEFGVGIFQKGRTTMDLKDKWRNISKAYANS